jgi:hypothetical protein
MVRLHIITYRLKKEIYNVFKKTEELSKDNIEQIKRENKDYQTILSWLEEYSTIKINNADDIAKVKLNSIRTSDTIPLSAVKTFLKNEKENYLDTFRTDCISFSESCIITIEEPTFDIFKLENEVGQENTLSTISCYIFTSMGLYSLIQYEKFENFIHAVTKGYSRTNPYHNVNKVINLGPSCCRCPSDKYDLCQ